MNTELILDLNDNEGIEESSNNLEKKVSLKKIIIKEKSKKSLSKKSIISTSSNNKIRASVYKTNNNERKNLTEREEEKEKIEEKVPNEIRKFSLIYSPRTTFSRNKIEEDKLFKNISMAFDPITIKILKSHFKERLGSLSKLDFIGICKNHLLSWNPNLPNREIILIKLLNRLFTEIDLNGNEILEWEEFTNYIIHNSNNDQNSNVAYSLRQYSMSKNSIDDSDFTEIVTYTFYIEKYNMIGIVQDGKSIINFYDGSTLNKLKTFIDIKETQQEINELEIKELDIRAKDLIIREEEEKKLKKQIYEEISNLRMKGSFSRDSLLINIPLAKKSSIGFNNSIKNFLNTINTTSVNFNNTNNINKKKINIKRIDTPEKLKKELNRLKENGLDSIKNSINKKLTILTTEFIPEYDALLVSSSNNKISAWKYYDGEFKNANHISNNIIDKSNFSCAILSTSTPQYTMSWDAMQKFLYTGQMDGKILKWDITKNNILENEILDFSTAKMKHELELKGNFIRSFKKTKTVFSDNQDKQNQIVKKINEQNNLRGEKLLDKVKKDNIKRDSVSCILILGKLQLLAAGYYNGNVILWDTMLKDYRKYYIDQDTCIYQIIYDQNKNLIFTCGFDHDIYIYDPYIDCNAIYKLVGHNISINSIAINPIDDELISLDIIGNIKIWDINNFYNFQSINVNESYHNKKLQQDLNNLRKKKISSNLKMIFLTKSKKILTYGDKNITFEADSAQNPDLVDDQLILGCYYNNSSCEFIVICLKKIKIWNAFNGKVVKIYDNVMNNNEITSYTTDLSLKRLYLGDNYGKIKNFNMNNGSFIKDFNSHFSEIIGLLYSDKYSLLISLSTDGKIKFHNDKNIFETNVIKEIEMTHPNITSITLSEEYSRLIIGLENGFVKFFDIEHIRFDADGDNEKDKIFRGDPIFSMISLYKIPIIVTGHRSGKIKFIIIPPNINKFIWFSLFYNTFIKDNTQFKSCVISMEINKEKKYLFLGDQNGFIHCYNLNQIYNIIKETNNEINKDTIEQFSTLKIDLIYSIQAHRETVKKLIFPKIIPNIIISTSNDRQCKIFNAENGKFIDELKQIASKYKDVPIGIKYYFADPFQSKRNKNDIIETGIIYRKDIDKHKSLITNSLIQTIRKDNPLINSYARAMTAANAKERLYLITKNSDLPYDKSNNWNLNIDLNEIEKNEKKKFDEIYNKIIQNNDKINEDTKLMQKQPIYSENYIPTFLDDLSEEKAKDFSVMLSQKLRHVKLAMAKIQMEKTAMDQFKKEDLRNKTINLKQSMAILNDENKKKVIKIKPKKIDKYEKKRKEMFGIKKRRIKSYGDKLDFYREDFDKGLSELKDSIEKNIVEKYLNPMRSTNKFLLPKIGSRNNFQLTDSNIYIHTIH